MSVAARDGFIHRPVVDEWGLAFAQAIKVLVPGWRPKRRRLRGKDKHDIDEVGLRAGFGTSNEMETGRRQRGLGGWSCPSTFATRSS